MSTWQRFFGWLVTEIDRQPLVPPADIVPGFRPAGDVVDVALDDTPTSVELERTARDHAMRRLIHRTLLAESLKDPALRNGELTDFCLEARSILQPSAPGSEVLREVPPVGIRRPSVPVIPGWTS